MKLYHGTCEDCGYEIYKSGYLEVDPNNSESATNYIIRINVNNIKKY